MRKKKKKINRIRLIFKTIIQENFPEIKEDMNLYIESTLKS